MPKNNLLKIGRITAKQTFRVGRYLNSLSDDEVRELVLEIETELRPPKLGLVK